MEIEERYMRLNDELQIKDKERELSFEKRRTELEAKYEIKMSELRKTELTLENTKNELENNFRSKLERMRDEDAQHLRDQKGRLEQYFSKLTDKFQKMVEQHKRQQDAEAASVLERSRSTAERQAADEVAKRAEFLKVQHAHESELLSALSSLRDQIATMEGQQKATRAEVMVLHAQLVEKDREMAKREGDLMVANSKELGEQAVRLSSEITARDSLIGELRKEVALKDRDARVLEEQMRTRAEVEFQIKYMKIQQEFEQQVFAEAESRKESLGHQLAQAREELAKKEREMMDQLLKLRKEQELELAQKRITIEKEANERYQKLQNEMFENERKRELEKAIQSAELEDKHERLARKLEEDYQLKQEKMDKHLVEKERKLRADFRELEKNIELDKANLTLQLQQQYDQKMRDLESTIIHIENEKLAYAQNLITKFDKLRHEDSVRIEDMKKRLTDYEQQLMDQFQKLHSDHNRLVEAEGAERYRSLRDALHTASTRDAQHSEALAKHHAAQDAEVANTLARLKDQLRELELRATHAQDEANQLRARLAEGMAQHQTQLADQSAAYNAQISEVRAMLTSEVAARDRRVAQLTEQASAQEREGETVLVKHKQDIEHKIARKYEGIHKDMRQQLLAELSDALEDREKLLRDQEEAMRKDEMEMLKRMHQMQEDIVAADRQREHDRTKYKGELDQQNEKRIRQAERELQQAKEAFESELIVKHQKLQTELLEKDRERDQQKETFRREIMKKADEKLAELRELETRLQKERMDFEANLRDKYDHMKREDQALILEERKRLEEYEKDIFSKFQTTTVEYRRKVDEEAKERIFKEKEEMEVRTGMLAELKQKKAEFDREMSYRQQKMQDELLERERLKEADHLQKQIQLEDKYQQKTAELRDMQLKLDVSRRDFELQTIQKFEKSWDESAVHLKTQRKQLEDFHAFLLGKFQKHVREHQTQIVAGAKDHSTKLALQAQELSRAHDDTIAEVLRHAKETDAALRGLRDRIMSLDDEHAALIAEIAAEKAAQLSQRITMQQEKESKVREYEDVLSSLRQELQFEMQTREEHTRVLEEHVGKMEDERASWELRTRTEIEKQAAATQRDAYKTMEERLVNEAEQTRKSQEDIARAREANLQEQESMLLAKLKKLREDSEAEFLRRKAEIEKEKFGRMQVLQEEHHQRENERDFEKSEYCKELETKYEERMKQLRDREKEIDNEKIAFEREVMARHTAQKEEDLKAMRDEKLLWDQRDLEIHHNFVQSMDEFKRQLESDAKERAELWDRLLHHDQIELELQRQKESLEQMYINKHQKLMADSGEREAEILQQKSQYMKNVDALLEQKMRALREKEEKLEKEKQEYEVHLRELHEKSQEEDKAVLGMHRQRVLDYEKNLYEKFQKMVETQTTMLEQEFEERQTRQHNVIKAWSEDTLAQQRDQRRQQSEVERGFEESIKMLHDHIQELEGRAHDSTRALARLEAEGIINASTLTSSHHQELLSLTRQSQSLKAETDRLLADKERVVLGLQETIAAMNRESAERRDLAQLQIETRLREEYDKAQITREKNLLEQVSSLHHARHEQQMKERIQFENDLRLHYEQLQLESEKRIREWITDVVGQYAEKGHAARAQMEIATRSSIESMIAARLGAEEGMREDWDKFTRTIHEKYETLLSGLQGELVDLRKKEEARRLAGITGEEGDFHKQVAMEKAIMDKYDKILRTQQEEWVAQKKELEEQLRGNLHKANIALVELEKSHSQLKIAFEQELRAKYAQLIAEHQATIELTQKRTLSQEVEHMQFKMQLEQDRTRVWEEVEKKCRVEYQEKYTQLLADVETHWKKDAATRESRVHAQLKQHYETLVSTKQQQVDLLMQLNNDVDQAERVHWQQVVNELKQKHVEIIRDMDEKIKSKYDILLKEYDKQYQQQLQQYETAAVANGGSGGDRLIWEKKMRRCKAAFSKWKYDYQVQTQAKYESILSDLHAKYGNQYNNMAQAVAAAKEKDMEVSFASRQKEVEMLDQIEQATAATLAPLLSKGVDEGRVAVLKASIERLWDALGTDQDERQRFFNFLHQAAPYADKVIQIYEKELTRLNDQLQLMQTVTRREFVKHRLECLDKYEESSPESAMLRTELEELTHQLRAGLPSYQRQHSEPFLYKNHKPYSLD